MHSSSIGTVKSNLASLGGQAIRRTNTGGWAAVTVAGGRPARLLDSFDGPGAKSKAIKRAGTNRVID